tara:strand:- start:180 stop:797 length:618 start_codon:yes stop_codon:yes gene_type:complete
MELIFKYFPEINLTQKKQFDLLLSLYSEWNARINVISRRDMDSFYEHHVLHSLGIAKILSFQSKSRILDVGTGGGFPGIPLAILFPEVQFVLIDSIKKKINVVREISMSLGLKNITVKHIRAELYSEKVDFIVSRAVTQMNVFVPWVINNISLKSKHKLKNGIFYLKGGDLTQELKQFSNAHQYNLKDYFQSSFFETKKVVHLII